MDPTAEASALVTSVFQMVTTSLQSFSFTTEGQRLLGIVTMIAISYAGIKSLIASEPFSDVVSTLFGIIFTWGIASFIIGINGAGAFGVLPALGAGFDYLSARIIAAPDISSVLARMLKSAVDLYDVGSATQNDPAWYELAANIGYSIANFGMRIVSAIFVTAAALIYAGQYLVSQLMFEIGIKLAPIMVPWIMFSSTEFIFGGWLKFMVVAGLQKVVGALFLAATTNIVTNATNLAARAGNTPEVNFYVFSAVLVVLGIVTYLMMQISTVAQALISGHGIGTFRAPSKLTPGGMGNAASNTMTRTVGGTVGGVAGGLTGGSRGAKAGAATGTPVWSAAKGAVSGTIAGASRGAQGKFGLPKQSGSSGGGAPGRRVTGSGGSSGTGGGSGAGGGGNTRGGSGTGGARS